MMIKTGYIRYSCCAILLVLAMICNTANAQFNGDTLQNKFIQYQQQVLQEKLYMHVDRTFYLAGDMLWFKIYMVDAGFHKPLDLSKVAYVELFNDRQQPVLQTKISLSAGSGNGSLSLPVTMPSGNYLIRAYTNWMKNAGADYFFEKTIRVVNTQRNRDSKPRETITEAAPDIQFFPEGGNLVAGFTSRIGVKVTGADGKGIDFSGTLFNENNEPVTTFNALQFGMGSFSFLPQAGQRYKAVVMIRQQKFTKELPAVYKDGYAMQLMRNNGKINITVNTTDRDNVPVYLLMHTRQTLPSVYSAAIRTGTATFSVEEEKLPEGITSFTLFNAAGNPVCERLFFHYKNNPLHITLSADKKNYETRSAVDWQISPTDEMQKNAEADMSVSVYRLHDLQPIDNNTIQSYLLLQSDLKGYIESPGYYFGNDTTNRVLAIDNLMLTQGWRRFSWNQVLSGKTPALTFPPEMNGHIITGKVSSTVTGKPLDNIETYVSVPGLNGNTHAYISDADGKVLFDLKRMHGSQEIIVQTSRDEDTLVRVDINNPFSDAHITTTLSPLKISVTNEKILADENIAVQVQNIYAGVKIKSFSAAPDTVSELGKPDAVYFLDNYVRFNTTEEVMREYVEMMDVMKRKDKFSFQLLDNFPFPFHGLDFQFFASDPLIMIDGVPIVNTDKLIHFDPRKMRKLEVYNHRHFMGSSFFSGILNWTTYKGDLTTLELESRAVVIDYEGMQLQREFYSPVYNTAEEKNTHLPDQRTLLYWSPSIVKNAKGEYHVNFYTSDKKGKYVAIVEGLTPNGQSGSGQYLFEVK